MTPLQAAAVIGCTKSNVLSLIRRKRLKAKKVPTRYTPGYHYKLEPSDVDEYAAKPQRKGWRRGTGRQNVITAIRTEVHATGLLSSNELETTLRTAIAKETSAFYLSKLLVYHYTGLPAAEGVDFLQLAESIYQRLERG